MTSIDALENNDYFSWNCIALPLIKILSFWLLEIWTWSHREVLETNESSLKDTMKKLDSINASELQEEYFTKVKPLVINKVL